MKHSTISLINKLNSDFYQKYSKPFDISRQSDWSSFKKLVKSIDKSETLKVLDIGCGNGRFAKFIYENFNVIEYIGIDNNEELIQSARNRNLPDYFSFKIGDIKDKIYQNQICPNLIVCFGVMHHIASYKLRQSLIQKFVSNADIPGVAIISFWQFMKNPKYKNKLINPHDVEVNFGVPIDDLENRDYFLGWNGDSTSVRYCHYFVDDEIIKLANSISYDYKIFDGSLNDRMNRYVVARIN